MSLGRLLDEYVGRTQKILEAVYTEARSREGIVFLDECDALLTARGGAHETTFDRRLLADFLVLLDGDRTKGTRVKPVIILAATNYLPGLDPAIRSRFDVIYLDLPDARRRAEIFRIHLRRQRLELQAPPEVDVLARRTPSFSGREIKKLLDETGRVMLMEANAGLREALLRGQPQNYVLRVRPLTMGTSSGRWQGLRRSRPAVHWKSTGA